MIMCVMNVCYDLTKSHNSAPGLKERPVIRFDEMWNILLQPFSHFFRFVSRHKILLKAQVIFGHDTVSSRGSKTLFKATYTCSKRTPNKYVCLSVLWICGWYSESGQAMMNAFVHIR